MNKNPLPLPLYRASHVRELDRIAIEDMGISGICLMERAGTAAFHILQSCWPKAHRIIVVCGLGNNAGDGYVLARLAYLADYDVTVLQIGETSKLKGDALMTFRAMNEVGLSVQTFTEQKLSIVDVVVDALFGTGLDREIKGKWREVIESMNRCSCPILSIDMPSGLHADTGTPLGVAVHATVTSSFVALKQGLFTGEGPDYSGEIFLDDLKVPSTIYKRVKTSVQRLDSHLLEESLKRRSRSAHKGKFGHVLVIGGDRGMIGAIRLAAEAAMRVGAGLVSVATQRSHSALVNLTCPEFMSHGVKTTEDLAPLIEKADVIAIGPGLGQTAWSSTMLESIKDVTKPVVIDADALNLLAKVPFRLTNSIITPHPGEAARLLGISVNEVQNDRFAAIQSLYVRFGGVCVLKGAGTLVSGKSGEIGVCTAGNPGMASGGMGDVLTGVIAGLLAQGFSTLEAAKLGVCLHGKAGDRAALQGERGLLASDLFPWLRYYANPDLELIKKC